MHHSGPLSLTFEGPEQGFGGKNCQNRSLRENLAGVLATIFRCDAELQIMGELGIIQT